MGFLSSADFFLSRGLDLDLFPDLLRDLDRDILRDLDLFRDLERDRSFILESLPDASCADSLLELQGFGSSEASCCNFLLRSSVTFGFDSLGSAEVDGGSIFISTGSDLITTEGSRFEQSPVLTLFKGSVNCSGLVFCSGFPLFFTSADCSGFTF